MIWAAENEGAPVDLQNYLDRIGFEGVPRPNVETLEALQRAHALAVPFENLDVQLARPLTTCVEEAYDKIVGRRRGGWCYEQNGVFGWALQEIGFDVARIAAGVMRAARGDDAIGNHLCLIVDCNGQRLADVGFGGSMIRPLPLAEGRSPQAPYALALSIEDDGHWRFTEQALSDPFSFDFRVAPADEKLMSEKCAFLQKSEASPFVQNLVAQRRRSDEHLMLRGRVLTRLSAKGETKEMIEDSDALLACLRSLFDLDEPAIGDLWPAIVERHDALFADADA